MDGAFLERGVVFNCEGESLIGVIALPAQTTRFGVLIVVGGPQYRAGSHRQFVLLARYLAKRGIPSMRFDYRGMGDSGGIQRSFERIGADLRAAIDCFCHAVPAVSQVALWGLCDGASAALLYAHHDERVVALALLNPWVRTEQSEAKAYLRHYYLTRSIDPAFWRKMLAGGVDVRASLKHLAESTRRMLMGDRGVGIVKDLKARAIGSLPDRMVEGLARFRGSVLLVLSGKDLTAQEFADTTDASPRWRELLADKRVARVELQEANHTFSTRMWRDQVAACTYKWLTSLEGQPSGVCKGSCLTRETI